MKITFLIETHNLQAAALVEKTLKKERLRYAVKVDDKPSLGAGRNPAGRKKRITKSELAAVVNTISQYPVASDGYIGSKCNVSSATVGRIRSGKHALQIKGNLE